MGIGSEKIKPNEDMKLSRNLVFQLIIILSICVVSVFSQPQTTLVTSVADLEKYFHTPPDDSKIMIRWRWFGPFISEREIERDFMY